MKGINGFALGIIDNDKKQIKYLENFNSVDQVEGDLILWRHKDLNIHHWIIQICPALEKWILKVCETEHIDMSNFGVNAFEGLKHYTKSLERLNNSILSALFSEINKKDNNINVRKLKNWIKILKEKNYLADINELKNV